MPGQHVSLKLLVLVLGLLPCPLRLQLEFSHLLNDENRCYMCTPGLVMATELKHKYTKAICTPLVYAAAAVALL